MYIPELTKKELTHIALVGSQLNQFTSTGRSGVRQVLETIGSVQLDPLNPAGRNHDLFFMARVKDYTQGLFEAVAYPERRVFESYSPNLYAITTNHFPSYYSFMEEDRIHPYYKRRIASFVQQHPEVLGQVLEEVRSKKLVNSQDLRDLGKASADARTWKTTRVAGSALEYLWLLGKIVVAHRDHLFRKSYAATEECIPKDHLYKPDISEEEYRRYRYLVKRQSYSVEYVGALSGDSGRMTFGRKKVVDPSWFGSHDEFPILAKLRGTNKGLVVPHNWDELLDEELDNKMRPLAPLDPLIWDRDLTELIFGFDYTWEVYKKEQDRKWGYYVYPLLYRGKLVGRLEAKHDKKKKGLSLFNCSFEKGIRRTADFKEAFSQMTERWVGMVGAEDCRFDESVPT